MSSSFLHQEECITLIQQQTVFRSCYWWDTKVLIYRINKTIGVKWTKKGSCYTSVYKNPVDFLGHDSVTEEGKRMLHIYWHFLLEFLVSLVLRNLKPDTQKLVQHRMHSNIEWRQKQTLAEDFRIWEKWVKWPKQ